MCRYANNLYNVGLYNIRQHYFNTKTFLRYESNYHECKTNENYGLLQAGISQQILRVVDRSFKSYFNLINKAKSGEYRFQDIEIPHYRKKGGMFVLILSTNAIAVKNGYFVIPVSREFTKLHGKTNIRIPFPERLVGKTNNQNFTQIPFGDLREYLSLLCERYDIQYIQQEESYTSKSSYLDKDELPVYKAEQPYTGSFSGKRIYRGLYKSADGSFLNADVNGAANILRKVNGCSYELPCSGCLAHPLRINFS